MGHLDGSVEAPGGDLLAGNMLVVGARGRQRRQYRAQGQFVHPDLRRQIQGQASG